ncbi:MAG: Asp-tRNA(Asn)/Glu-tRNA(Gln) amidotransferase subunit GatA [Patescibacteria group bacterium]|nr:Asp-tRNA(Asn)/Glu-tRNA(Gln) amidotransferase subunit GatA [Patescibacteria group bacterium]MCL5095330.1 Asp-tRNA(Asn)/Glu-tRNA(Gln) amidotransferase subunit GatA [Patescibacteria group bacterium]
MNLNDLTVQEAIFGLTSKKFSAREVTSACLEQIKKLNKEIKAYLTISEKEALEAAEKSDQERRENPLLAQEKPLLGIPVALKDLFCTKNMKTTAASRLLKDYFPQYDATVVSKLKKAGAVILGKTNCDAWAHGASGENSDFGPTKNPWNKQLVPGGSSSGSAAALISSQCLAATGTDTGGSVRLPAAFCGVVGLKPTYGRVSRYGIIAMASSMDAIGHFTRTVYDSALLLKVTAGKDNFDATTPNVATENFTASLDRGIKNLKIGIPKEYFGKGIDRRIEETIKKAVKKLEALGAKIIEVSLPHTEYALAVYYIIQPSEVSSNLARYDGIRFGLTRDEFGDEAKRRIMLGTYTLSAGYYDAYYLKAMKVRTLIKKDFAEAFNKVDVLIAPTSPNLPWKLGEKVADPLKMYLADILTVTANLAGIPGLSLPCGFVEEKGCQLPVGMQILGPHWSEKLLFQVGHAYERETNFFKIKPKL